MTIRNKLTLRFAGIFALLLGLFSITVYFFTSIYREREFYEITRERALATAHMLLEADEVTRARHQKDLLMYYRILPDEIVKVYDSKNKLIFSEGKGALVLPSGFLEAVRQNQEVALEQGLRQVVGIFYPDNQGDFVVIASDVDYYSFRKLKHLQKILIIGFFGSILVVLVAGWLFSKAALRPITKIVSEVEKISASDLHLRLSKADGIDEVSHLAHTFNNMLDRLETAFEMQTTFVSSASHELRTPLTAMIGELEVAQMKKRTPEEYHRVLASTLEDARRLVRLSNGLLQIAQASADPAKIKLKPLRFDELVWSTRDQASKRYPETPIELQFEQYPEEEDLLILNGNEALLEVAFLNVFENAAKFSEKGKSVMATFTVNRRNFKVSIQDQGIGITQSDLVNVFVPFWRAQNVRGIAGHGIGLPLAEKIIKLHRGTIQVFSSLGKGTEVVIQLPSGR